MEEERRSCRRFHNLLEPLQPYLLCIFATMCFAGSGIIVKISLNQGMSPYVLIVYGHAIAALTTALLSPLFERGNRRRLKPPVFINIFFLALLGPIMDHLIYNIGLGDTSTSFASTMHNLYPAFTFVVAILCRMEKLEIMKTRSQAKVVGTIVALGGAILMTLYKGVMILSLHSQHSHTWANSVGYGNKDWTKGSILLIASSVSLSGFYILQVTTLRQYPAPFSLNALVCLVGSLQGLVLTIIMEPNSSWWLGWDITLVAAVYCGVMTYGIGTCAQLLALRRRGPVFVTSFHPLTALLTTLMGLLILGEELYLGGVIGAFFIVIGLYLVLWGKQKDINMKARETEPCRQALIDDDGRRESNNEVI